MDAKSGSCFQQLAGCGSLFSQQAFKKQAKPRIGIERENETIGRCITNTPGLLRAMAKASEDAMNVHDCPDADKRRNGLSGHCLLYTSPSPRDLSTSRMPSSA